MKYLTGLVHTSTSENVNLSILTRETDYSIEASFQDASIRSAGFTLMEEDEPDPTYFIHNGNSGFGVDLGANLQFSEKWTFGLAINDLGIIHWKDYAEEIQLSGASFRYEGLNLDDMNEVATAFSDSLENIQLDTLVTDFKTTLNSRTFLTASYNVTKGGFAQASLSSYFSQGRMKSAFGVGYLQNVGNWFSVSTTASLMPQNGVDVGAGLMLKGGFFQVYAVADNLINTLNAPEAKSLNFKFGINFLFGKYERPEFQLPEVEETE